MPSARRAQSRMGPGIGTPKTCRCMSSAWRCAGARTLAASAESSLFRSLPIEPGIGGTPMPNGAVSQLARERGSTPHITTAGRASRDLPSTKEAPAKAGSASMASIGSDACADTTALYCAIAGRVNNSSTSKAMASTPERAALPGKRSLRSMRSSKSAEPGNGMCLAPVSRTVVAKRLPVRNRTL